MIDQEGFQEDSSLISKLSKNVPKKPSYLKRDFDARAHSEAYRAFFRLPGDEKLDGTVPCSIWDPAKKKSVNGTMYLSNNYVCFQSKVSKLFDESVEVSELLMTQPLDFRLQC